MVIVHTRFAKPCFTFGRMSTCNGNVEDLPNASKILLLFFISRNIFFPTQTGSMVTPVAKVMPVTLLQKYLEDTSKRKQHCCRVRIGAKYVQLFARSRNQMFDLTG